MSVCVCLLVCVCVCVRVHGCTNAYINCVRNCVRVSVYVCTRAFLCACVCVTILFSFITSGLCFVSTLIRLLSFFVGQLMDAGFRIIDALDPASEMLDEAKKKNIYRNFYNCFMTGDPLDIPAGWLFCLLNVTLAFVSTAPDCKIPG